VGAKVEEDMMQMFKEIEDQGKLLRILGAKLPHSRITPISIRYKCSDGMAAGFAATNMISSG
jgi:hypothetical protein